MISGFARSLGRQRGVISVLVGLAGSTCIAVAVADQEHAPQPPAAQSPGTPGPTAASTRAVAATVGRPLAPSLPRHLSIPAIGVSSSLLRLGLTPQGAMEVPAAGPNYDRAGWYSHSPTPGSLGPAVIVGHVDSATTGPSVFFRLGSLRPEDRISVSREDGSVAVFAVDEVRRFHKARFPSDLVYGNTQHAAMRLVTCGGEFDATTGHYLDNIVVLASLVGIPEA